MRYARQPRPSSIVSIESQRPDIARTVHHAHDDDFLVGKAVIQHIVKVEMRPQPRTQTLAARADLGMRQDSRETLLDIADQLRCGPAIVLGDEGPEVDEILLGAVASTRPLPCAPQGSILGSRLTITQVGFAPTRLRDIAKPHWPR